MGRLTMCDTCGTFVEYTDMLLCERCNRYVCRDCLGEDLCADCEVTTTADAPDLNVDTET